jgi:hypothetical protein
VRWRNGSRNRAFLFVYSGAAALASLIIAMTGSAGGSDPLAHFTWVAAASVAALSSQLFVAGVWSAAGMFATLFWCFHFGLVAALAMGVVRPSELSPWDHSWVLSAFSADAARLALAGCVAYGAGAGLVYALRPTRDERPAEPDGAHPYGPSGAVLVFVSIAAWFGIVLATTGVSGLFGSYVEYLDATADFSVESSLVWVVLGCGFVLAVTGKRGLLRTAATAAFAALALIVLPIGLRGEILFRWVAAMVAAARCGRVMPPAKAAALAFAVLAAIPVFREIRETGLRGLPAVLPETRPWEALAEMGSSLHPVEKVVRWHAEGEPLDAGGTYWAPIERAAARLLPGARRSQAQDDLRIMNVLVIDRVGPIGFSPVAEAYRNFGAVGVSIVIGLLGALLAGIDTIRDRRTAVLTLAVVYVPLLTYVRNSFISVPAHCAMGLAIVLALVVIRHVVTSVIGHPYACAAHIRSEA